MRVHELVLAYEIFAMELMAFRPFLITIIANDVVRVLTVIADDSVGEDATALVAPETRDDAHHRRKCVFLLGGRCVGGVQRTGANAAHARRRKLTTENGYQHAMQLTSDSHNLK